MVYLYLCSNSKNYWEDYGYLVKTNNKLINYIVPAYLYDEQLEDPLNESTKYKYIKSILDKDIQIVIKGQIERKNEATFYIEGLVEDIIIDKSYLNKDTGFDRITYMEQSIVFPNDTEELVILEFIKFIGEQNEIKTKKDYLDLCSKKLKELGFDLTYNDWIFSLVAIKNDGTKSSFS